MVHNDVVEYIIYKNYALKIKSARLAEQTYHE